MLFPLYDLNPHYRIPWFTLLIIGINVAVTVWSSSLPEVEQSTVALQYGFVPARLSQLGGGQPVPAPVHEVDRAAGRVKQVGVVALSTEPSDVYPTFVTTMFLHGGWLHLITNMWMLWVFGNNIEDRLGHFMFLAFYAVGGFLATMTYWFTAPNSVIPVVGASGAVAAVLGGYAVTFPAAKVRTLVFFIFITIVDMPALLVLGIWFVLQVFSGLIGLFDVVLAPVAFWAHVGGFVAGMILLPVLSLGAAPPGTDWRKESDDMFRFDDPRSMER